MPRIVPLRPRGLAGAVLLSSTLSLSAQFAELPPGRLPAFAYGTRQVLAADLDGDRHLDLIALARVATGGVLLLRNDGFGVFTEIAATNVTQGVTPDAAATGDLDGDGDVDLVLARSGVGSVFLNDGQARFIGSGGPTYSAAASATLLLVDVDRDGDLDILDSDLASQPETRLWRNDGRARFVRDTTSLPTTTATSLVVVLDIENDGDPDVVVLAGATNPVWVNDGTGRFTEQARIVGTGTNAMAAGDVDRDGDQDLVAATSIQGNAHVLVNDGTGNFVVETGRLPATAIGVASLGDVDADGDLDVLWAGLGNQQISLGHNDGRGFFTDVSATHMSPRVVAAHVALADFDGDRHLDLIVPGTPSRLYAGSALGTLTSREVPEIADAIGALGDVDGDADADLVIGTSMLYCVRGENLLAHNDGMGRFTTGPLASVSEHTTRVRLVDLDGDGDLDLLEANSPVSCHGPTLGGYEYAYFNDGSGRFSRVWLPGPQNSTYDIVAADVDGDGDQDVLVANAPIFDAGQNRLYLNRGGTLGFDDATARLPADTDTTREILAGDVDGDGDVDLICVNAGQDRLYLNDGTGRFSDATRGRLPVEFSDVFAAASHDFDGDGDLDLMLGGRWLYLNDGAGVFTDVSGARMPPLQDHSASIGVVDVDRDGDLDVVLGTRGPLLPRPPNLLLLNHNGSFTVAPATRFPVDQGSYSLLTGDIDADGDADVLFTSVFYPYVRAYLNLERQVFAPRVLQPGRPYTLQFYARAGYATGPQRVVPFVGFDRLAPQPIRFPDWGAFRLVVNQVVQLPVLAIPFPTERLAVDLVVPSELDASRLYIQALVLHSPSPTDWGFSNVLHLQR